MIQNETKLPTVENMTAMYEELHGAQAMADAAQAELKAARDKASKADCNLRNIQERWGKMVSPTLPEVTRGEPVNDG